MTVTSVLCPEAEPLELLAAAVLPPLEDVDAEAPLAPGLVVPELVPEEPEEEDVEAVEVEELPPVVDPVLVEAGRVVEAVEWLGAGAAPEHPSAPAVRRMEILARRFMPQA